MRPILGLLGGLTVALPASAAGDFDALYGKWVLAKKESAPFCYDPKDIEAVTLVFAPGKVDIRDPLRPWATSAASYSRDGDIYVVTFGTNTLRLTLDGKSLTPEGPFGQPGLCHFSRQ